MTCPDLFSFDLANLPFVCLTGPGLKTKGLLSKSSRFSYSCLISLACALVTDNPERLIKAVASASTFPHPWMPLRYFQLWNHPNIEEIRTACNISYVMNWLLRYYYKLCHVRAPQIACSAKSLTMALLFSWCREMNHSRSFRPIPFDWRSHFQSRWRNL